MNKRIGILGGAFDPIHFGHLALAAEAVGELRLNQVLFIPTFITAHQHKEISTPFAQRLAMVELAISGHADFAVADIEGRRGKRSYTVETLRQLHEQNGNAELYLLIGADNLSVLDDWRQPEEIDRLATTVVAVRPGYTLTKSKYVKNRTELQMPLLEISASNIRARVRSGRSIRFLVPAQVAEYIDQNELYQ